MLKSNNKPQFIPFYTALGFAAQAGCITPETLLLGQTNYAGDQIWPSLLETMQRYDQHYTQGGILHIFSGMDDEHNFLYEDWETIFDYLLDPKGFEIMDQSKIKTEQEAINFFLEYASNNNYIPAGLQYFTYTDPETNIEHLFMFFLI